ncbi:hypothetical protein vBVpaPMGD2_30 [Vibrio phage vB_VpaP_MGD2]|uniref:Uncharacterized protein n=1 Tax=Vibrio phage vB_VpaP_MGD2 TaxID=2565877 RepID=A0A6B7HXE7_9CAUD|nr:hypothetical protein vBVpaPMGD2_30 [Vibrio phage vB_VpaP_MGD2]
MSKLVIKSLQTVVAGKFVDQFVVVDEAGNLVGSKAHKTEAEAQAELGGLKYYAEGLEFARATAPDTATEKSMVAKANVVAAYLMYKEQAEAAEEAPVAEEAVEAEAPVEEVAEDEEF